MESLIKELTLLQSKTLGLFKNKYSNEFELVIEYTNDKSFTTITIQTLAGLHTTNYSDTSVGQIKLFPTGFSLLDMMNDVFLLDRFIKSFN